MITAIITFPDGTSETIKGYRVYVSNGVLHVRACHPTDYTDTYIRYPLASIRKWETSNA